MKLKPLTFIGVFISAAITAHSAFAAPVQQAYLKASNTKANLNPDYWNLFGLSVAVSSNTVVVGASGEGSNATGVNGDQDDNSLPRAGAAYVFARNGTNWTQQAYLKASHTATNAVVGGGDFGHAVAISGDTIVVGAYLDSSVASQAGAAYVFVRNGNTWSQQAYLQAFDPQQDDLFGTSVAISGDTIVVGARGESSNATGVNGNQTNNLAPGSGAAYVFVRNGGVWTEQAYLKASDLVGAGGLGDSFGVAVAVSGDIIVVGARGEDSNATGVNGNQSDNSLQFAGAAYVFVRNGTTWSQQAYLKASNTDANDIFGSSVAVSGDTVVVGAYQESGGATGVNGSQTNNSTYYQSGAAYVFTRSGTNWSQQAYLKPSDTEYGANFGISVAASGDTVLVGAYGESSNATGVNGNQTNNLAPGSGAAYFFVRNGTNWSQQAYLKASNTGISDIFGVSVGLSGDTAVAGASWEDSNTIGVNGDGSNNSITNSGAAYIFAGLGNGATTSPPYFTSTILSNGAFQFSFNDTSNTTFTVVATTNVSLAASNWTVLGLATETPASSGHYQFTEPQPATDAQQLYRVRSP